MSDSVRVRAIYPTIYGPDSDRLYKAGDDWEADRSIVQPLIDQGQLEEVVEPSLLIVPEIGLYLPSDAQPEAEADSRKPRVKSLPRFRHSKQKRRYTS